MVWSDWYETLAVTMQEQRNLRARAEVHVAYSAVGEESHSVTAARMAPCMNAVRRERPTRRIDLGNEPTSAASSYFYCRTVAATRPEPRVHASGGLRRVKN